MPLISVRAERTPRCLGYDLRGGIARALGVDVLAEPGEERYEIALRDAREDARIGALCRVEELRRGHRAQGVGREIAPGAVIPVNVLQAALAIVGWHDAEERAHAVVPRRRQLPEREIAGDHCALE